jgi:hypothetical protein
MKFLVTFHPTAITMHLRIETPEEQCFFEEHFGSDFVKRKSGDWINNLSEKEVETIVPYSRFGTDTEYIYFSYVRCSVCGRAIEAERCAFAVYDSSQRDSSIDVCYHHEECI